ncbi:hypothetical protein [Lentzea flava]|uniref:Uncharacterized protein n=1 Tax=Lentzea flava TaxID=103732 RepID=A0ABQ2UBS0_9PSEU|nr:hypothetical protein [Lentzea flava]MCP2196741.1 hypothetical protein [Lentzea flava]GGU15840.1 hypothetical protein GCM10010178_04300 [Lentzea flava]
MAEFDLRRGPAATPVEVVIPVSVAFDIEALFDVQRKVFERLGHPSCNSGADIRFTLERRFIVDAKGTLRNLDTTY